MRSIVITTLTTLLVAAAWASHARAAGAIDNLVRATLLADADAAVPGTSFTLGVRLKIRSHWHTYWANPGETGEATRVTLAGPAGFTFGAIQWPIPSRIEAAGGVSYGYEDEVLLLIPVTVAKDVPATGRVTLNADVAWLACKDTCIPGRAKLTIDLPVRAQSKPASPELFDQWRERLPLAPDAAAKFDAPAKVDQPTAADGSPAPVLNVQWKTAPKKVEWFPLSTPAAAIDNVVVTQEGATTRISYKPTIYKPDAIPNGRVDGLLVYEDATGRRVGLPVNVRVPAAPPPK